MTAVPEHANELAVRLYRAHVVRTRGEDPEAQTLDDLAPHIRDAWRTLALCTYDVLGVEGVNSSMAAIDNIANSRRAAELHDHIEPSRTPADHLSNVFGGSA